MRNITLPINSHILISTAAKRELLRDRNVLFAGYKMPHPLEHKIEVKIQTSGPNIEPSAALQSAIDGLKTELDLIKSQFEVWLSHFLRYLLLSSSPLPSSSSVLIKCEESFYNWAEIN